MEKAIIIRFCEIHLKGKNRRFFENLLLENIERSLKDVQHKTVDLHSRYLVTDFDSFDYEEIVSRLKKVAGIHSLSLASVVENDPEKIIEEAIAMCVGKSGTFKVETNRAEKNFPYKSVEFSALVGGKILERFAKNLKVNVKNPDFTVNIDIREDGETFLFTDYIAGIGGMPVGSSGKGLLLISGGIDSPVAGYMTAKRGMKIDALHFESFPYTGEAAKEKVIKLAKMVAAYNGGSMNLYVCRFTEIQEAIHKNCPEEFMITLMRRFMMRISERLALKTRNQAIITGENLGQVASQTIESITSSNSVVTMPVLRPLIMFDKLEIIALSEKIGTYETSILPYEDCCTVFLPKFPAIKPNLEKVIKAESALDVEGLIERAISGIELIKL